MPAPSALLPARASPMSSPSRADAIDQADAGIREEYDAMGAYDEEAAEDARLLEADMAAWRAISPTA
eukprot:9850511-Alexandrium_andersonii.AAC.1